MLQTVDFAGGHQMVCRGVQKIYKHDSQLPPPPNRKIYVGFCKIADGRYELLQKKVTFKSKILKKLLYHFFVR